MRPRTVANSPTIKVDGADRTVHVDRDIPLWVLRDVKRHSGLREPAASLDIVRHSRISKAAPLVMLAPFVLMMLTGMEVAVADSTITRRVLQVEHVEIDSTKSFAEVEAALESQLPQLDPEISSALAHGDEQRAKELERGADLFIFLKRDHGALLEIAGGRRKALQYDIGNPLTASKMTRHQLSAGLYAPLRVYLRESPEGEVAFEYDRPVNLFGQFGNSDVDLVAKDLDALLERTLRAAAS